MVMLTRMAGLILAAYLLAMQRMAGRASVNPPAVLAAIAVNLTRRNPPVSAALDSAELAIHQLHAERRR
jgi:hypothetical protein